MFLPKAASEQQQQWISKAPGLDVAAFPEGQAVCAAGSPFPAL